MLLGLEGHTLQHIPSWRFYSMHVTMPVGENKENGGDGSDSHGGPRDNRINHEGSSNWWVDMHDFGFWP